MGEEWPGDRVNCRATVQCAIPCGSCSPLRRRMEVVVVDSIGPLMAGIAGALLSLNSKPIKWPNYNKFNQPSKSSRREHKRQNK